LPDPLTVQLVARATEVPTAEILVLDCRFQFVARGVGTLDTRLAPGAYTIQYKAGSTVVEVPAILRLGAGPVTVDSPPLTLKSPAPLAGNEAGARYGDFARQCSREIHGRAGSGGQLFVFVRTAASDAARGAVADSLGDVRVLDADANVVAELASSGQRSSDGTSLGYNLQMTPGSYLLRYRAGAVGLLEQTVVVSKGWQTQVFASSRPFGASEELGPNFPEAAIFMARQGLGFEPNQSAAVRSESARQGLDESRRVAPEGRLREVAGEVKGIRELPWTEEQIFELLQQKFGNPTLGIYGIHLLLLNPERDWDLLREVVTALKSLVGEHPDVMALTALPQLSDLGAGLGFEVPPMLRNSWKLVVGGSAARPELVPTGSYAAGIASRTWGSGAWLVWRPPAAPSRPLGAVAAAPAAGAAIDTETVGLAITRLQRRVLENIRRLGAGPYAQQVAKDPRLTDTERAVLLYSITAAYQGTRLLAEIRSHSGTIDRLMGTLVDKMKQYEWTDWVTGGLELAPAVVAHFTTDRLVRALAVPLAALNQAIVSLADKVARDPA
jgi:hypothetical protein